MYGVSREIVEHLLLTYPEAASHRDREGKAPLHLAFHEYKWRSQPGLEHGDILKKSMNDIVEKLCRAAAWIVVIEDIHGMSALEYAIEEEAEIKIVQKLQIAAANHNKNVTTSLVKKRESRLSSTTRIAGHKFHCSNSCGCIPYRYQSHAQKSRRLNYLIK